MQSKAATVDEYILEAPDDRQDVLRRIRKLCREILIGYREAMVYGGPTYQRDKGIEVGFASQKNEISFYCIVHQVMIDNAENLKGYNHGKGVIRFSSPAKVDFDLIRKILIDTERRGETLLKTNQRV